MSTRIPDFPTRPDQVPAEATVTELLDAYHWHLALAVGGRSAAAGPDDLHARHAVAALAVAQVVIDTFVDERWPLVRDALARGAAVQTVGDALWLEVSEIAGGLRSWADWQHGSGRMSLDEYDAVMALIEDGAP